MRRVLPGRLHAQTLLDGHRKSAVNDQKDVTGESQGEMRRRGLELDRLTARIPKRLLLTGPVGQNAEHEGRDQGIPGDELDLVIEVLAERQPVIRHRHESLEVLPPVEPYAVAKRPVERNRGSLASIKEAANPGLRFRAPHGRLGPCAMNASLDSPGCLRQNSRAERLSLLGKS